MVVSARMLKWAMRLYPPLFFQRIWVQQFHVDFTGVQVKINRSLLNANYNRSIFGGTIFSAADAFYPVLFYQLLRRKGFNVIVWSRSAEIHFLKKSSSDLYFNLNLPPEEIQNIEQSLSFTGRYRNTYPIKMMGKNDEVCVTVDCEVYIKDLNFIKDPDEQSIHE